MVRKYKIFLIALVVSSSVFAAQKNDAPSISSMSEQSINLESFQCESNTRSSFLSRLCYDKNSQTVVVALNNTYQKFCGIPVHVVGSWLQSDSMGRYYFNRIKGNYDCKTTDEFKG